LAWNQFQVEAGWPLGFLGTAYVLEALSDACAGTTATNLIAKNRIPGIRNGVRFLQGHADADEGHIDMLRRLLGAVSSKSDQEAIALSGNVTSSLYLGLFSAIATDEHSRQAAWMSAARLETPSLSNERLRCFFTVWSEIPKSEAMRALSQQTRSTMRNSLGERIACQAGGMGTSCGTSSKMRAKVPAA
jgi:hypothetical protein